MLSEVVTCNCVRNPGGHAESNPGPSEEGLSFYHVLRPLDIEHLLFECQCIPGLDGSVALALLRENFFRVCSGLDHAEAVLLEAFPTSHIPVVAATASSCVGPFLLDPAAALGRMSPWHMKLQCLDLVAAFLLGLSSAVCTH